MTNPLYYRTIISVEVLSEGLYDPDTLSQVDYDTAEGDCSGSWEILKSEQLTREEMAEALIRQGSCPSFIISDYAEEE